MKATRLTKKRLRFEQLEGRRLLSVVPSLHAAAVQAVTVTESANWSGYAITTKSGYAVKAVYGSWTVPAITGNSTGYSADWVGIDGYKSPTVEQIGTESDNYGGTGSYYAWYEMFPRDSYTITPNTPGVTYGNGVSAPTVNPGDMISASVTYEGSNRFLLAITDSTISPGASTPTLQWQFSATQSISGAQRSSAEWVVEAPSSFSSHKIKILPLANFGTVNFTGAYATIVKSKSAVTEPIDGFSSSQVHVYSVNMANRSRTEDTTLALTDSGTPATSAFSVKYDTSATSNSTPPSGQDDGGRGWSNYVETSLPSQVHESSAVTSKVAESIRDQIFASLGEKTFLV